MSVLSQAIGVLLVCSPMVVVSVMGCRTIGLRKTVIMLAGGACTGLVLAMGTHLMFADLAMARCW